MNDRLRQKENLSRPHKVTVTLSEEYKRYMNAKKKEIKKHWHVSSFHNMKLSKKALCGMLKKHGCRELGFSIDWYVDVWGMGQMRWTDSSDDGWMEDTSVRTILSIVKHYIRNMRPYLKNPERVFWWEQEDCFKIFIFLRDTHYKYDFCIWWKPLKPVL